MSTQKFIDEKELKGLELMWELVEANPDLFFEYYPSCGITDCCKFCSFDGVTAVKTKVFREVRYFLTEIKVRDRYSFEAIEGYGGASVEYVKASGMRDRYEEQIKLGKELQGMIYVNFFSNKIAIYNLPLDKELYNWKEMKLRKNNYSNEKKIKKVADLKFNRYGLALFDRKTFKRLK